MTNHQFDRDAWGKENMQWLFLLPGIFPQMPFSWEREAFLFPPRTIFGKMKQQRERGSFVCFSSHHSCIPKFPTKFYADFIFKNLGWDATSGWEPIDKVAMARWVLISKKKFWIFPLSFSMHMWSECTPISIYLLMVYYYAHILSSSGSTIWSEKWHSGSGQLF